MEQKTVLELFDRYGDTVYRVALGYLRSPQEAEDAVQTIFLRLLERDTQVYPGAGVFDKNDHQSLQKRPQRDQTA